MDIPVLLYGFGPDDRNALGASIRSTLGNVSILSNPIQLHQVIQEGGGSVLVSELNAFMDAYDRPVYGENQPWIILVIREENLRRIASDLSEVEFDALLSWPVSISELADRVREGQKGIEIRRMRKQMNDDEHIRLQATVNRYRMKETISGFGSEITMRRMFHNMKTVLGQGRGLGALVSMAELISEKEHVACENCLPPEFKELLKKNARHAEMVFEAFHELDNVIRGEIIPDTMTVNNLYDILEEAARKVRKYANNRGVGIVLSRSDSKMDHSVHLNTREIEWAATELLLNATKFSAENTEVFCILQTRREKLELSILNVPVERNGIQGIPEEHELSIFEPFFRLDNFVHECEHSLDYGLGLTRCKKILERHGGSIRLHNVTNHLPGHKSPLLVHTEISLPLASLALDTESQEGSYSSSNGEKVNYFTA